MSCCLRCPSSPRERSLSHKYVFIGCSFEARYVRNDFFCETVFIRSRTLLVRPGGTAKRVKTENITGVERGLGETPRQRVYVVVQANIRENIKLQQDRCVASAPTYAATFQQFRLMMTQESRAVVARGCCFCCGRFLCESAFGEWLSCEPVEARSLLDDYEVRPTTKLCLHRQLQ